MAALAMLTAACSSEDDTLVTTPEESGKGEVKMITETIRATNGDGATRANIDAEAAFSWSTGDQIAVHVSDGKYYTTDVLLSGGSSEAVFTVEYPAGSSRDAFAFYPASIVAESATNYGQSDATLDVTLPSSYTLDKVSGNTTPCPMIATNTAGSGWEFKQLCGLLRLTVGQIPTAAKRLEIDFNGKKVCGNFSITSPDPGTSVIATSEDANNDKIVITKDRTDVALGSTELVLNIPLPVGAYTSIDVVAYDALSGGTPLLAGIVPFSKTAARAKGRKATALMAGFISLSATKKVIFAPGNLQYLGNADGTGTWRFADHQYDFMGDGPSSGTAFQGNVTVSGYTKYNTTANKDVARDLFGWGTSGFNGKNPYMTSTNSNDYFNGALSGDNSNYNWGVYHSASGHSTEKITNGGNYSWYLPTQEEWYYVMNNRKKRVYTREDTPTYTQEKKLFAFATVVGVKGLMLFPDNWDGSLDRTIVYENPSGGTFNNVTCDAAKWATFEQVGCVFLPVAQVRKGESISATYTNEGHYWSSSISGDRGCCLEILSSANFAASTTNNSVRYLGQSVRLIRDIE